MRKFSLTRQNPAEAGFVWGTQEQASWWRSAVLCRTPKTASMSLVACVMFFLSGGVSRIVIG
jgi:hypothetical protein